MFRQHLENLSASENAAALARKSAIARASEISTIHSSSTVSSSPSSSSSIVALQSAESQISLLQRELLTTTRDAQSLSVAASQQLDDKVNELNATRSLLLMMQEKLQKVKEDKRVNADDTMMSTSSSLPTLPAPFLLYAQSIDSRVKGIEMVKERLEKGVKKLQVDFQGLSVSSVISTQAQQRAHAAFVDLAGVSASLMEQVDQQNITESRLRHEVATLTSSLASALTTISSNAGMIELQRAKLISQSAELDLAKETLARRSAHVITCQEIITQQESASNKMRSELLSLRSESDTFGDRLKQSSQFSANELASKNAELLALATELATANNLISKLRNEAKPAYVSYSSPWQGTSPVTVTTENKSPSSSASSAAASSSSSSSMMEDDSGAALLLDLSGESSRKQPTTAAAVAEFTPTTS
jgi:chromosome segregation ATPase